MIHTLTDNAQLFIFVYSPVQNSLLGWSSNSQHVLGIKDYEVARDGNLFLRHTHPEDRYQLLNQLETLFSTRASIRTIYRWIRPDSQDSRWILCRAEPVERQEGLVYEGMLADISTEVQALGGTGSHGQAALRALNILSISLDTEQRVLSLFIPKEFERFDFGDPEFNHSFLREGRVLTEGFSNPEQQRILRELLTSCSRAHDRRSQMELRWNGKTVGLQAISNATEGNQSAFLLLAEDRTEPYKLREEARQLKRADNFVSLTSSVFHNINNSLQTMMGYAAAIQRQPDNPTLASESAASILRLLQQTAELTHQTSKFKDNLAENTQAVDLNIAVMSALNRVHDLLASGIKIAVSLGNIPSVNAHAASIVESIEALIRSTIESAENARGFTIQTFVTPSLEEPERRTTSGLCQLSISTTIASANNQLGAQGPETSANATSTADKLQLNWSRHGASVQHETNKQGGFTTSIVLSTSNNPVNSKSFEPISSPQILLVDDDELLADTLARILSDAGLPCITAADRKNALKLTKAHKADLKLIILDAILPSAHGSSILRQLRKIKPTLPILGFSGAAASDLQALLDAGASRILRKPIPPNELVKIVKELIAQQQAA